MEIFHGDTMHLDSRYSNSFNMSTWIAMRLWDQILKNPRNAVMLNTHLTHAPLISRSKMYCTRGRERCQVDTADYDEMICTNFRESATNKVDSDPCRNKDCLRRSYPHLRFVINIYMSTKQGCLIMDPFGVGVLQIDQILKPSTPIETEPKRTSTSSYIRFFRGHAQPSLICYAVLRVDSIRSC